VELSASLIQLDEAYNDPGLQAYSEQYQQQNYGSQVLRNGTLVPFGASFIQETTVFREFGPLAGSTLKLGYDVAPKIGNTLSRQSFDADVRHYLRIGTSGLLATRVRGFKSIGDYPDFIYFGGNSEMRGYDYLQFAGQNVVFANAELRFPLIEAALTPIGVIGGIRGVFFANIGGGSFSNQPTADPCATGDTSFKFFNNNTQICRPIVGVQTDAAGFAIPDPKTGLPVPLYGSPVAVSGFRLQDGRASYGICLETFALGFPIHFDWAWRTLFNKDWEDVAFAAEGGSNSFRKARFAVWIGYDF